MLLFCLLVSDYNLHYHGNLNTCVEQCMVCKTGKVLPDLVLNTLPKRAAVSIPSIATDLLWAGLSLFYTYISCDCLGMGLLFFLRHRL